MPAERNLTDRDLELLSAYLDDALSSEERAALDARLTVEPELRRELAELRQTVALVHDFSRTSAPRNFTLTAAMVRPPRILFFPATAAVSAMSAVAALVLVVAGALLLARPASPPMPLSSAPLTQQVAFAPTATLTLGNASNGALAQQPGETLDKVTQATEDTEVAADQIAASGGLAETTEDNTTLSDGFFGEAPTEELGYAARSAMPTFEGEETEQQAQGGNQPDGDANLAASSAEAANAADAAEAAAPAPMAAAIPPQGTATIAEPMSMQMAAPSTSSDSSGGAAANASIAVQPSETPTETATATNTLTPTPSPTSTFTPTATVTASPVPSITPSPTPAPFIQFSGGNTGLAGLLLIIAGAAALLLSLAVVLARRRV